MKKHTLTKTLLLLMMTLAAAGFAKTVTLNVQADKPVLLNAGKQTVYLRIGMTGCPVEMMAERTPVNVAIVIDKSGSMSGEKIAKAKQAAILAVHRLKSTDIVSVVLYDSDVEVLVPATRLTKKESVIRKIRQITAGGSTALYAGVQNGAEEVRKFISKNNVNRVVLLSDGLANVGPDSPSALGKLGANLVDEGISVTTIGLGLGYNEDLMSRLAYKSDGGHYFAETADELASVFDQEFGRALSVVAQQVNIEIICPSPCRPVRILGREGLIKGQSVTMEIQNIYSEHEKYAILEVEVPDNIDRKQLELADVRIQYHDMKAGKSAAGNDSLNVRFTGSQNEVDKHLNKAVLADAVEQIAIENNRRAVALRDVGQIEKAKQVLTDNVNYLRSNAGSLDSEKLEGYAAENESDADNLEGASWTRQRKAMRESQTTRRSQR